MSIQDFFGPDEVRAAELAAWLDGRTHEERRRAVAALGAREQAALFEAARGHRPIGLADFVPPAVSELTEVVHHGKNSLPAFRRFQKRFCRPGPAPELWGYNEQAMRALTGPGYFVVHEVGDGEVLIDYCRVPLGRPVAWPPILPNSARLSRFIYYRTKDLMRGVSRHVTVGRASRDGEDMDNWFVLCRDDAPVAS